MAHEVASSESAFELEELLERRIAAAVALRKALRINDGVTNVYRLINRYHLQISASVTGTSMGTSRPAICM